MINPINPTVLHTNDALSKQQRQDQRRRRKRAKNRLDESRDRLLTLEEEEHLDLVA